MDSQTSPKALQEKLLAALAISFELYQKSHTYHFNVIGSTFAQDHEFLKDLYEELNDHFDTLGELCRQQRFLVPLNFESRSALPATDASSREAKFMYDDLSKLFELYKVALVNVHSELSSASESGARASVENLMIERDKRHWMIRALTGEV